MVLIGKSKSFQRSNNMYVYADNAATTAMSQVAIDAMIPYMNKVYGNPSSLHSVGQEAKEALEAARETVAKCLGSPRWPETTQWLPSPPTGRLVHSR